MDAMLLSVIAIVALALIFDYTNGFHDAANAIATSVSTRALTPRAALLMAAIANFIGAFLGDAVAKTVGSGIIEAPEGEAGLVLVAGALIGAITWNMITWYFGMPSSSSHALIGFLVAGGLMVAILWAFRRRNAHRTTTGFRRAQVVSAAAMAVGHGLQDAQKTMGIIVLALVVAGYQTGTDIPLWVKLAAASAISLGTYSGGWRVMRTLGRRIIHLDPARGFAAETAAATVLFVTAFVYKAPISTTQTITGSIMGVGATKRLSAVRWGVAGNIAVAWVLTLPAAALVAALVETILRALFL